MFAKEVEGLAFDAQGYLYAVDETAGKIEVFTSDGRPVHSFGGGVASNPASSTHPTASITAPSITASWWPTSAITASRSFIWRISGKTRNGHLKNRITGRTDIRPVTEGCDQIIL